MTDDLDGGADNGMIVCPLCGAVLRGKNLEGSERVRCPKCNGRFALTLAKAVHIRKAPVTQMASAPFRKLNDAQIPDDLHERFEQVVSEPEALTVSKDARGTAPSRDARGTAPSRDVRSSAPPGEALANAAKAVRASLEAAAATTSKVRFSFTTLKPFSWATRNGPEVPAAAEVPAPTFKTPSRFEPTPAEVLAICCCDGRYIKATEEFLHSQGIGRHDLVAVPGGPALLTLQSSSTCEYMAATHALDFMTELHHSKEVVLIAHVDCAYYRQRYQECDESRQKNDLRRAHKQLSSKHPDLKVALYYARPLSEAEGEGVVFEEVLAK